MKSKFTLFLTALSLALMSGAVWADHVPGHDAVARGGVVELRIDLDQEIVDRIAGDAALQEQINAEAALRDAGDSALKLKLEQETAARVAQDNSLLGEIGTEISARQAGDAALQAQINGIGGGAGSGFDADLLDGLHASNIIAAAQDEVRIPIDFVPFTISTPGSYYLTGDLTVSTTDVDAILVNANNVTIDLMGFSLVGPGSGAGGSGSGIRMITRSNVTIKNGTVRDFGNAGIYEQANGHSHRIINVRAIDNNFWGIGLFGRGHFVKDCTASGNINMGILAGAGSTVTNNTAFDNGGDGITVSNGSTVTNNTAISNGGDGIVASNGSTVTNNTAFQNDRHGIDPSINNLVMGNTAVSNNVAGTVFLNIDDVGCPSPDCTFVNNHAP